MFSFENDLLLPLLVLFYSLSQTQNNAYAYQTLYSCPLLMKTIHSFLCYTGWTKGVQRTKKIEKGGRILWERLCHGNEFNKPIRFFFVSLSRLLTIAFRARINNLPLLEFEVINQGLGFVTADVSFWNRANMDLIQVTKQFSVGCRSANE